jgi:hypothetical protein
MTMATLLEPVDVEIMPSILRNYAKEGLVIPENLYLNGSQSSSDIFTSSSVDENAVCIVGMGMSFAFPVLMDIVKLTDNFPDSMPSPWRHYLCIGAMGLLVPKEVGTGKGS